MGGHSHVIVKRSKSMFALFKFGVSFCLTGPRHSTGQFAAVCNRAGITSAFKKQDITRFYISPEIQVSVFLQVSAFAKLQRQVKFKYLGWCS